MSRPDYDVLIIGGGLVGASLACALRGLPLRVGVVEARPLEDGAQPSFDARSLALAWGSRRIFEALGLWEAVAARGAAPIRRIRVTDRGRFGTTRLEAARHGVEAFGYVVESRVLGAVLGPALAAAANVDHHCPAEVTGVALEGGLARVAVETPGGARELSARLLVAADGTRSRVRELCGVGTVRLDYRQSAVIANIRTSEPHGDTAHERFTPCGPLALLPLALAGAGADGRRLDTGCEWSLVWTHPPEEATRLAALDEAGFLAALQPVLPKEAGEVLAAGTRHVYPLGMVQARAQVRPRLAIIGNAAHTLHPVAGQGFNLGLRDVAALAEVLAAAAGTGADPGAGAVLERYARWRRRDRLQVSAFTDALVRVFSNDRLPVAAARNAGLLALDLLPPLKNVLARHAMGLAGRLPRMVMGLPPAHGPEPCP